MSTLDTAPVSSVPTSRTGRGPYWLGAVLAPLLVAPLWIFLANTLGWPSPLNTFAGTVLVLLLVVSTVTDLHGHRIYNWATYTAFLYGVGINILGESIEPPIWLGAVGLANALIAAVGCFVLMCLLASGTGGGSGDIKLATAMAVLLGVETMVTVLLLTYTFAGVAVLLYLIVRYGPGLIFGTFFRRLIGFILPGWFKSVPEEKEFLRLALPLAPFFTLGTFTALVFMRST